MKLSIKHACKEPASYKAARVRSLFNAESASSFTLEADLPLDEKPWQLGVVVGPSGSGKSSIGGQLFDKGGLVDLYAGWPKQDAVIDAVGGTFEEATAALSAVGLGDVPAWLRPFSVLSNGEKFRAGLARLIVAKPAAAVVDEFTSVVDRQIARVGALAFAKAWRRTTGQVVLLTPHYDVLDWLQPDWVFDTKDRAFLRGPLWRRPAMEFNLWQVGPDYWRLFEPHYYLKLPRPVAPHYFLAEVDGEPVAHLAVTPRFENKAYRATRLVVMPEWQGAGVGIRFLETVAQFHLEGRGRLGRKLPTQFHTSHPGLCAALRNRIGWRQMSANMWGGNKAKSAQRITHSKVPIESSGYGGHFRAVQGFAWTGREGFSFSGSAPSARQSSPAS